MAPSISTFMLWARIFQVVSCVIIAGSNGFLIQFINTRGLGLDGNMIILEILAVFILIYTFLPILVLHMCRRSRSTTWIVIFVAGDLFFTGVCIAMISLYSFAGVPRNCGGMTRSNFLPSDTPNIPAPGYTTIRFGNGTMGNHGMLDYLCSLPQTDFAFCIVLIFTYTLNTILAVLRILSFSYTHKEEVTKLCKEAEREAGKDFAEVKALINRVVSLSIDSRGSAPSFRSSPSSRGEAGRYEPLPSFEPGGEGGSGLYDAEEEDVANGLVTNGPRGVQRGPPPYVPGREDTETGIPLGRYGKDQEFPGLR